MAYRSSLPAYRSPAQRRARGELQLCLSLSAIFAPLAFLAWLGFSALPAHCPVNVGAAVAVMASGATAFAGLFAWLAVDAWGRK